MVLEDTPHARVHTCTYMRAHTCVQTHGRSHPTAGNCTPEVCWNREVSVTSVKWGSRGLGAPQLAVYVLRQTLQDRDGKVPGAAEFSTVGAGPDARSLSAASGVSLAEILATSSLRESHE